MPVRFFDSLQPLELRLDFITQNFYLVLIAAVSGGMLLFTTLRGTGGGKNSLTPSEATQLINRQDAQIVDVREPDEYAAGHLPESRNIPAARLEERAGELDKFKDTPLILVCQTGARSGAACPRLTKLGFSRVSNLGGGLNAWREAGLPLKKGTKK
jgi:rhodanese-related sulfurtransferase